MKTQLTLSTLLLVVGGIIVALLTGNPTTEVKPVIQIPQSLAGVNNFIDTSSSNVSSTLMLINTTSTHVFDSITKFGQIQNITASTITCSMDATGITAASSTVLANRGVIITSTSTPALSYAAFGECYPGSDRCYAHKGAVNCLASSAVTVPVWSK